MIPGASAPGSQLRRTLFLKDRSEWRREEGSGREEKMGALEMSAPPRASLRGLNKMNIKGTVMLSLWVPVRRSL